MSETIPMPPFFEDLQTLAREHAVIAYVTVAVVVRDGKASIASCGGSKLQDGAESTAKVYHSMSKAFDEMVVQLSEMPPNDGLIN
jgi:hypothetical protein